MSDASKKPEDDCPVGMSVVRPSESEVFVDLDGDAAITRYYTSIGPVRLLFPGLTERRFTCSRSHRNRHAVIDIGRPVVNATERIVIELALGSDPIRGLLGMRSIAEGRPEDASVFFEYLTKDEAVGV